MTSLADQSTMAPWPTWVWIVAALMVAAYLFLSALYARRDARAEQQPAKVTPIYRKCAIAHCHQPATVWVMYADGTTDVVCPGDADRGEHRGWFYVA